MLAQITAMILEDQGNTHYRDETRRPRQRYGYSGGEQKQATAENDRLHRRISDSRCNNHSHAANGY